MTITTTKHKKETKEPQENIDLLKEIVDLDQTLRQLKSSVHRLQERKDLLLQEAVDRKIEKAGKFMVVCTSRMTRTVDIPAVCSLFPRETIEPYLAMTLASLEKIATHSQIDACTQKKMYSSFKVVRISISKELTA